MEDQSEGWKLLTSSLWCISKCLASQDIYNKIHDKFLEICPNSWKVTTNYHEANKIVEMCQYFLNNNNNNNLWFSLLNKECDRKLHPFLTTLPNEDIVYAPK
jgi:hypothetical protein